MSFKSLFFLLTTAALLVLHSFVNGMAAQREFRNTHSIVPFLRCHFSGLYILIFFVAGLLLISF